MEQQQKFYPVGIQTFSEIIGKNYLYIDKTEYVYRMTHSASKYMFLSRPRRFGKSLLTSTLHCYFEGRKELFKGLAIEKLEAEWNMHPVLHFDMSTAKHMDKERLDSELERKLLEYEEIYGRGKGDVEVNQRLQGVIQRAYQQTGKQVVVLIDEYDAPLLDVMHEDKNLPILRNVMRNFYSPLKACDPYLRYVFLTGITKFSQLSIFSELNNIKNISMDEPYAAICGITEEEIKEQMSYDLDLLAEKMQITRDEVLAKLKENYDGYHFTWPSPDIYNPFSLFNAFDAKEYKNFWFSTGTPTFLIDLLQETDFDVRQLEGVEATDEQFDAPTERVTSPIPVLYQSGYLTIKGYDPEFQVYRLAYPNGEVRKGFIESLLPAYLELPGQSSTFYVVSFIRDLRKGDIESCLERTRSFFASIPNDLENKTEKHYQTIFYLLFRLMGMYVDSEVKSAVGRADVVIKMQDAIYVLEFKYDGTAREALAQINSRLYAVPYRKDGRRIVKVGINFDSATRTIGDWVIEVEDTVDNL